MKAMANDKTVILITGRNSGVGFALAELLLADKAKHVVLGSRSAEKGKAAVEDLQSRGLPGEVELLLLDVDDEESVAAAARLVDGKHGRIDALVNNAAIGLPTGTTSEQMLKSFRTNSVGPEIMGEYFVPLLKKSNGTPRIVNVSSGAGSISRRLDPDGVKATFKDIPYRASKAAMNMVSAAQADTLGPLGFRVFTYNPGFCVSNLSLHNTTTNGAKPASEGAAPMIGILNGERDEDHAKFMNGGDAYYAW